jgi:pyruvate,orthophosphate dikinase
VVRSTALEVNRATYHVDVDVAPEYEVIREALSRYYGLAEGLEIFLKELSHPYRNRQFIVSEAKAYSLDYFHLLRNHEKGPTAARRFVDIFCEVIENARETETRIDAVDNLLRFLQKIIREAGDEFPRFRPMLEATFDRIYAFPEPRFFYVINSHFQIKRIAKGFLEAADEEDSGFFPINRLLFRTLEATYDYWLQEPDPGEWFSTEIQALNEAPSALDLFEPISKNTLETKRSELIRIQSESDFQVAETTRALSRLPDHNDIVDHYRSIPRKLYSLAKDETTGNTHKLLFLFRIMNPAGLSAIHEDTLREINRIMSILIASEQFLHIEKLINKTFQILQTQTNRYPDTALNCVLNMGQAVYRTDDIDLINLFIDHIIDLGFQSPMIGGVGNDWQTRVNYHHIRNIRVWMELIEMNPRRSLRLLSALIIHLSLCGVYIRDTDLFPRDITRLLNSDIRPVYNQVKQLTRLFPTYFNDIGAEGELREISTKIDEINHRKDPLVYFLRKQTHVESSNRSIGLIEEILRFWKTRDPADLEAYVPPDVYAAIDPEGPYVEGVSRVMRTLSEAGFTIPNDLLEGDFAEIDPVLSEIEDAADGSVERVRLAVSLYRLLHQKYSLAHVDLTRYINQLHPDAYPELHRLQEALSEKTPQVQINKLLEYLELLKRIILSNKTFEAREEIYKKRHFTIDIPSMYGSYRETKFDALGLTFRIESHVNTLLENLVESADFSLITKAAFYEIFGILRLFEKALSLDGIESTEISHHLDLLGHSLEVRGFTFTQYIDIFKGFAQSIRYLINDYFHNIHEKNLNKILRQLTEDQILPRFLSSQENGEVDEKGEHRISEIFHRDLISASLGLRQFDRFIGRILSVLYRQFDKLEKEDLHDLLLYDTEHAMVPISLAAEKETHGIIDLGNKGFNLVRLRRLQLPVPPGFIVTTEVFRFRHVIERYPPAEQNFREQLNSQIARLEHETGKRYGDPENPLLFSVRSGSSISQPGMMATFLNVGINKEITEGIARKTGNEWFAWDNYRRFLQCYGMSYSLKRDDFDAIIDDYKKKWGKPFKRLFEGHQMREVALTYRKFLLESGITLVEDPFEQLRLTIRRVSASWDSEKAKAFRKIMGISDDWGTAVTVQAMVFGNLSADSGTGVCFTHNPKGPGDTIRLWGDFTLGNQGEDVVSGLVNTMPISLMQQQTEMRPTDMTLETHFSSIYQYLRKTAVELIEKNGWSPQEIEFTFESPRENDLYLLQARDMAIRERRRAHAFSISTLKDRQALGHGIGVSGGALVGRVVFTLEEIEAYRREEPGTYLILLRSDTVPDDIREIHAADGILTSRGGLTSHAAVVAYRLDKCCIVGCNNLVCNERKKYCNFDDVKLVSGDFISMDGKQGSVYEGKLNIDY